MKVASLPPNGDAVYESRDLLLARGPNPYIAQKTFKPQISCWCLGKTTCFSCTPAGIILVSTMPEKQKTTVRRCLFGRPDHEVLKTELETQLRDIEDRDEKTQKWNFNFNIDRPIDGRYEWTEVTDDNYIPEFYRRGYQTRKKTFARGNGIRSDLFTHPAVQLDKLPHVNTTANCTPCVSISEDIRIQTESIRNKDSEVNSDVHVRSSSSNTTSRESSPVLQSKITSFMKLGKRKRGPALELHINRKSPRI